MLDNCGWGHLPVIVDACLFIFFAHFLYYFRTFSLSFLPRCKSHPGSLTALFSPLPATVRAFIFFARRNKSALCYLVDPLSCSICFESFGVVKICPFYEMKATIVVSLSFIFPHSPEDEEKKRTRKKEKKATVAAYPQFTTGCVLSYHTISYHIILARVTL